MSYAKKTDKNQQEIMDALRKHGAFVVDMSKAGKGFPDLVVGYKNITLLIEVKSSPKALFTQDQLKFIANWSGGPLVRADDVESALRILRMIDAQEETAKAD
jgi:Holliday junction resolvase